MALGSRKRHTDPILGESLTNSSTEKDCYSIRERVEVFIDYFNAWILDINTGERVQALDAKVTLRKQVTSLLKFGFTCDSDAPSDDIPKIACVTKCEREKLVETFTNVACGVINPLTIQNFVDYAPCKPDDPIGCPDPRDIKCTASYNLVCDKNYVQCLTGAEVDALLAKAGTYQIGDFNTGARFGLDVGRANAEAAHKLLTFFADRGAMQEGCSVCDALCCIIGAIDDNPNIHSVEWCMENFSSNCKDSQGKPRGCICLVGGEILLRDNMLSDNGVLGVGGCKYTSSPGYDGDWNEGYCPGCCD